jgi:predicted ATP-dependent serine protease
MLFSGEIHFRFLCYRDVRRTSWHRLVSRYGEETLMTAKKGTSQHLPKIATGIHGFDELSQGGLPRSRISLLKGGPGSGKTVFALQSLVNAARARGEPGIFVAFEESPRQIIDNAAGFDWDLPALTKSKLFIHGRESVARCRPIRRIRPARPAGDAQGEERGDRRAMDRV